MEQLSSHLGDSPKVVILGAGMAGLSAAWLLKQQGIDFLLLEKALYVGGMARSFKWHGFFCDFATHRLFTANEGVLHRLLNLVPMGRHVRRSCIYLMGHWMRDPLDVLELFLKLSTAQRIGTLWHYTTRPRALPELHFENYVLSRYGRSLYEFFFQPYTEKLFGIPGDQISVFWARQKVRLANPLDALRENTKTKFQYFYYPIREGYGAIVDRLFKEVERETILGAEVLELKAQEGRITEVVFQKDGRRHTLSALAVVSTLPVPITARMLGVSVQLSYQKVDAVYLLIDRPQVTDYHWLYFIDRDISVNRLVEFKNLSPIDAPLDKSVLCAEVTQEHENLVDKVISDLEKAGLFRREEVLDSMVVRENFAYPIYNLDFERQLAAAEGYFKSRNNLYSLGRSAQFTHFEADDNFEEAIKTVEQILQQHSITAQPAVEIEAMKEKMPYPVIFAVLLTYNHYSDTQECLRSLLAANYPELKIVVVDNGSSDGTPEKVRQEFPQISVVENLQNLGVPAGYNIGFEYALRNGADYVLMLNNDTLIDAEMITQLVEVAEKDSDAGIIMPSVLYYGDRERIWSSGGRYRTFPPSILLRDKRASLSDPVHRIEYAPSCGLLIHRRAFERAGLFDPGYFFWYDDWDFSERVRAHGLNIWSVPYARMWHKVARTTQGPRSPLFWKTYGASVVRFYRRHGRPVWFSLPLHVGYIILREFVWKNNRAFWRDFWQGMREGFQKPLGKYPEFVQR